MKLWVFVIAMSGTFAVGGCTRDASGISQMTRAADPNVKVPIAVYHSVSSGNTSYMPVAPKGWEELNRRVGPKS